VFFRLSSSIACHLQVIENVLLISKLTISDFGLEGRDEPKITSPFDLATSFCLGGLLTCFVYSTFSFWLLSRLRVGFELIFGILSP
jgi:hypothetical protein